MANIFEKNKTYLGDCLELMPQMENEMFDMILCDLPYGTTACKWDTIIPFEPLWKEYERLIKPNGVIVLTASQPFASLLICSKINLFKYDIIWNKKRPTGQLNVKRQPLRQHEHILIFYKSQPTYNAIMHENRLKRDFVGKSEKSKKQSDNYGEQYDYNSNIEADALSYPRSIIEQTTVIGNSVAKLPHPTQKPVALFEWLIKTYTNEGELILDNCAGSGTTAEACYNTGRNYIQIEKEQKYFDLILGREKSFNKKDYQAQTSLWNTANGI